jgi:hypothetical protein
MGAGTGTYNASFEGNGQITWAASCSATSNASIRGNWKITDNASGAVTETLDDNQTGVDAILVDTGTTIPGTITTVQNDLDTITDTDGVILGAAGVDLIWDEDIVAAHNTADTAGAILNNILPEKNAAFSNLEFLWVAASDHVTPVTSASTTSVTRSIDGGAFGSGTGTLAEDFPLCCYWRHTGRTR